MYTKVVSVLSSQDGSNDQVISFTPNGSDPNWTPKVAIVQWNVANTSADTFQEHHSYGKGFTDGTNQRCVSISSEDNQARADTGRTCSDTALIRAQITTGTLPAVDAIATFTEWQQNAMKIHWSDVPASQFYIHILFLGGDDITDTAIGTASTGTGTSNIVVNTLSFQGDYAYFISANLTAAQEDTHVVANYLSEGMATSSSAQWVQGLHTVDNPVTMDTYCYYAHDKCLCMTGTTIGGHASFSTFASNGFTLTVGDAFPTDNIFYYLVMKGGQYSVGNATEPGSVSQQTITTNTDVKAVGIFGLDIGVASTMTAGNTWSSGFGCLSSNQGVNVFDDTDNVADSIVVSRHDTNQIYLNITSNATAASSTLDDEAALYSVSATNFVLDWTNIGQARPFRYVAFGNGPTSVTKSLTTRYNIEQTITKSLTLRYDISKEITKQLTTRFNIDNTTTVRTQVVRFQKDSSGTTNATQDISLNFTPKAIMLFSDGNTADNSVSAQFNWIQGFSDGTNHACMSNVAEDGVVSSSDTYKSHRNDSVFIRLSETTGAVSSRATCAFGTDKVTFTWAVNDTAATYITLVAYGGEAITNAKVNTVAVTKSGTGTQDYTGLGFTPSAGSSVLFTLMTGVTTTGESDGGTGSFGAATSSSARWSFAGCLEDSVTPTDTWRTLRSNSCLYQFTTAGAVDGYADFSAWISDGFRLNVTDAFSDESFLFSYLVIKGGTWDVGFLDSPASPQSANHSLSVSSQPIRGLFCAAVGVGAAGHNNIYANSDIAIGTTDGTTEAMIAMIAEDNAATSDSYRVNSSNGQLCRLIHTDGINYNVGNFTSFGTNQVTIDWTTISGTLSWAYAAVADGEVLTSIEKQITLRYNLEQQITKQLITRYDITSLVEKSLTARYDVTALAEKTLTLLYDIEQEITKQLTTRYDITSLVEKTLTIIHNIEQEIEKSLTTRFNIEQEIIKSLTTRYDIAQEVIKSLTLLYDIDVAGLEEVVKTLTTRYNIEQEIEKSLIVRYDVTEKVPDKSLTLRYDITQLIEKTLILRYNIEQEIEKALTLLYNIEQETTKTLTTRYNIEQQIEKINTLRYDITALVEKPLTLRYNVTSLVEKTLTTRYDITAELAKTLTLRYNVEQQITKTNTLLYNIEQEIEKSLTLRYDIEAALAQVIKSLTLRYDITAQAIKSLTTRYNIEQQLLKSLSLRYDITQLVPEKAITLRYDILQQIVKTLTTIFQIEASIARYITDRGYSEPLKCRIQFVARGTPATVHYTYDSFNAANRPFNLLNLDIRLAQGEIGTFSFSIEDSAGLVDKSKIGLGVKVIIDVKKESATPWQRIITGFVRRIRPERPATGALIYEITGYGNQIVFNERIVNFKRAAKRTAIDSSIALSTDTRMEAHNLFRDLLTASDILPIRKPTLADTGGFTDLSGVSSDVINFISQIAPGLTDAASVANAIAEITGCIWGTDENGQPFLRYPTQKHSGIIIKDVPENTDSALDTSINLAPFDFDDSIDTTEGFANRLYVLNAVSTKSTASSSGALGSTTLTTRGIAQQFTSTDNNITGAAFILSKIGTPVTKDNCVFGYLRADNNGYPTGPTLASFQITFDQIETAKSTIFVNDIKPKEGTIIPGNKYWWFLFSALTDDSNTIRWHHDNDLITGNRISARLPLIDQDPTKPGNQLFWTRSVFGPVYSFSTFSSVRHILEQSDPESIKEYGLIEQIVDLPAFEDDATFQKALSKIIAYSAKPKRIYAYNLVTIPTGHLFFPGELVTVIDSKASLTSEKNVVAEIAEVTYNWDSSSNALGCKYADVHLIGFLDRTLDKYLDSKEC